MLSIQEVGTQIFNKTPKSFYVMNGSEYGIKLKYIDMLKEHYGQLIDAPNVSDLFSMMSRKHIVPLKPAVYVVRYDEAFMSSLNDTTQPKLAKMKIAGTIVCIYSNPKYSNKLDKYLPDYYVEVAEVGKHFLVKYLHADFPELPDRFIELAAANCTDYFHSKILCNAMKNVDVGTLYSFSDIQILELFGIVRTSGDDAVRIGVASRNFYSLVKLLDMYENNIDGFLYTILSTLLDLEKILCDGRTSMDIKEYVKRWTLQDVYNMFMNTFGELQKMRSISQTPENNLIYLISLLQFQEIPSVEYMKE